MNLYFPFAVTSWSMPTTSFFGYTFKPLGVVTLFTFPCTLNSMFTFASFVYPTGSKVYVALTPVAFFIYSIITLFVSLYFSFTSYSPIYPNCSCLSMLSKIFFSTKSCKAPSTVSLSFTVSLCNWLSNIPISTFSLICSTSYFSFASFALLNIPFFPMLKFIATLANIINNIIVITSEINVIALFFSYLLFLLGYILLYKLQLSQVKYYLICNLFLAKI